MARTDHVVTAHLVRAGDDAGHDDPYRRRSRCTGDPTIGSEAHHVHLSRLEPTRGRRPRRGARARTRDPEPRRRSGVGATRASRSPRRPQGRGVLRPAPPQHARRNGQRPGRRDAGVRGAEPGRRVGRMDHPHRWRRLARPRRTSAVDLRRDVSPGSRHRRRRGVQPDRNRSPGGGRLPGQRPVVVRERLRARRLDLRKLHRHVERRTAAPDRGLPARRGRDRGHVVGRRPLRHREPPLHMLATSSCPRSEP